jgi:hypothetical protein
MALFALSGWSGGALNAADPLDQWTPIRYFVSTASGRNLLLGVESAGDGYLLYVSTNATVWTPLDSVPHGAGAVNYTGGLFFRTGGARVVNVSPDGYNWTTYPLQPYFVVPPVRARGLFISHGTQYPTPPYQHPFWQSTDGAHWTISTLAYPLYQNIDLVFGNGVLLGAVYNAGNDSTDLYLSEDMNQWTVLTNALPGGYSFCFAHGNFLAFHRESPPTALPYCVLRSSRDGRTWSVLGGFAPSLDSGVPNVLFYANKTYIVFGDPPYIFSSPDGVSWTRHSTGVTAHFPYYDFATFWQGQFLLRPVGLASSGFQVLSGKTPPATDRVHLASELCRRLSDGGMLLTVEAPYGHAVTVEGSVDLATWTTIATDSCDTGEFEVYDEGAKALGHRFYRAWQAGL